MHSVSDGNEYKRGVARPVIRILPKCVPIYFYLLSLAAHFAMATSTENICIGDLINSKTRLTPKNGTIREKFKATLKSIRNFFKETTVEPCLFLYQLCTYLSSLTVQNMHLEKACRVNLNLGDDICDRLWDRNTTGLEEQMKQVHSLVAEVVAWKFPLQTAVPAVLVIFVGAWSDKRRKRKICILFPITGEIITNSGLLLATYYFYELSLFETALIEALPAAFTGGYIIMFMGMYSFLTDRTSIANRTFRFGVVAMCVNLGNPLGTALSGTLLRVLGYYGMFSLILSLHLLSFVYGLFRLEDVCANEVKESNSNCSENSFKKTLCEVFQLVCNTLLVALRPRPFNGRSQIFAILIVYLIMVGPLYGKFFLNLHFVLLVVDTSVSHSFMQIRGHSFQNSEIIQLVSSYFATICHKIKF